MLYGVLLTVFSRKYRNIFLWFIVFNVWIGLLNYYVEFPLPNEHIEEGKIFYNQEQYEKAMKYFKKASETYTWYLRFFNTYQYYQRQSLLWVSKTYIKTGELDKAKEVYELAIHQYSEGGYISTFDELKKDVDNLKNN